MPHARDMERVAVQEAIDAFWETFPPVWNTVRGNVRSIVMRNFEISVEQFHILRMLRRGAETVSQLAEMRQVSRPAVSQAVDVLVNRGWVGRRQGAGDRRFVTLRLTEAGEALLEQIFRKNRAWMTEKMAGLSDEELAAVQNGMEILRKAIKES